ncbi:hypothetical protein [Corallococcus caeni]|uniref:Glycosyltransferase RgtA/B/C/D-like domain-containing protein n=1 Tax=Corallococcus caeni TaxID=3082388 RepID=A0ABQ6QZM6_9BACT|nr:hypothetical protein ASNO1_57280 [Corallococcus sp. NO1]
MAAEAPAVPSPVSPGGGAPSVPAPKASPPAPSRRGVPASRLALVALAAMLALWPAFKLHLGPANELRVRFPAAGWPLAGQVSFTVEKDAPPVLRPLTPVEVEQVLGDGIPAGQQEVRVQLPRDARSAEVTLRPLADLTVEQVTWFPLRGAVVSGPGVRELPFEQHVNPDGSRTVSVARLRPGFWNVDVADVLFAVTVWAFFWLVLEARWGQGRAAAFARRRSGWARYALLPLLSWGAWWLIFFPGIISYDPLVQWEQLQTGRLEDWHPAFHTFWLWLVGGPFGSLAPVGALQAVLFATVLGKVLEELGHWRVPAWARWGVVAWVTLSPAVGSNVIAAWKDAPFTLMCLAVMLLVLRAERRGGLRVADAAWLGACLACITLLRHNGPALSVPVLLLCLWRYGDRRARGTMVSVMVLLTFMVRGPGYALANVAPAPPVLKQVLLVHRLGAVSKDPQLPPEDARVLEELMPLEQWRKRYACLSVGPLVFGSPLQREKLAGRTLELADIAWRYAKRHPEQVWDQQVCVTRYVWAPEGDLYIGPFNGGGNTVDPNQVGVRPHSWFTPAQNFYEHVIFDSYGKHGLLRTLVWQPSSSLYAFVLGLVVVLWRQRSLGALLAVMTAVLNTLAWLLLSPNPDLRFLFPTVLLAPLLLALALAPRLRRGSDAVAKPGAPAAVEAR